jgi:hypothetical protein
MKKYSYLFAAAAQKDWRTGIETGPAVQQANALLSELRRTQIWATPHPNLNYAAPYWATPHPSQDLLTVQTYFTPTKMAAPGFRRIICTVVMLEIWIMDGPVMVPGPDEGPGGGERLQGRDVDVAHVQMHFLFYRT